MRNVISLLFLTVFFPASTVILFKQPLQSSPQESRLPVLASSPATPLTYAIYFSPNGGCTDAVVREVSKAKKQILIQAYYLTSKAINKALLDAKVRGVEVNLILDKTASVTKTQSKDLQELVKAGANVLIDDKHHIAHNKIMILDSHTVITGSFNFTQAAEYSNAENLIIVVNADWVKQYTENWQKHQAHSVAYKP
jgi:phosphatidylserine/phosphatidylglycerophosphate/cardiolipin synthase-like enzyme